MRQTRHKLFRERESTGADYWLYWYSEGILVQHQTEMERFALTNSYRYQYSVGSPRLAERVTTDYVQY